MDDFWSETGKTAVGGFGMGGGLALVLYSVRWFITWISGRHDRREALLNAKDDAIDQRWAAYTKRIEDRCATLEDRLEAQESEVERCHQEKRDLENRIATLEGFAHGIGDRRQEQQLLRSAEHILTQELKGDHQ